MPRTSEQFKQIKDERKANILINAAHVFALSNKGKVSIDDISTQAGCSHGLVYHYFSNVEDVYKAILKVDVMKELNDTLNVSLKEKPIVYIKNIIYTLNALLEKDDNIPFVIIFLDNDEKNSFKDVLCSLVKRGQKDGSVSVGNPLDIADTCYYIYKGYCLNRLLNEKANDSLPDRDVIMQLFIRGSML